MLNVNGKNEKRKKLTPLWRIILEVGFIVFLFYSNLLMGEFTRSGAGHRNGILWALKDIFTTTNFFIAIVTAFIGHIVFDFFINRI
jgi:hypothetical protein